MIEIRKPVVGYEWLYEISNTGLIKSSTRNVKGSYKSIHKVKWKYLRPSVNWSWYYIITLSNNSIRTIVKIHSLVMASFIWPRPHWYVTNHIDWIKTNNCITNLEYCSQSDNIKHAFRIWIKVPNAPMRGRFWKEHYRSKKVTQYSKEVVKVAEYFSAREAMRLTGVNSSGIILCCNGKKNTAWWFIRKYATSN